MTRANWSRPKRTRKIHLRDRRGLQPGTWNARCGRRVEESHSETVGTVMAKRRGDLPGEQYRDEDYCAGCLKASYIRTGECQKHSILYDRRRRQIKSYIRGRRKFEIVEGVCSHCGTPIRIREIAALRGPIAGFYFWEHQTTDRIEEVSA